MALMAWNRVFRSPGIVLQPWPKVATRELRTWTQGERPDAESDQAWKEKTEAGPEASRRGPVRGLGSPVEGEGGEVGVGGP